ncbi:MAG: hypothetical protein IKR48_08600, partial [Kiritimatiellae bacterium]|nr:hypothetical protein [Kiritimatiellia bacterium]
MKRFCFQLVCVLCAALVSAQVDEAFRRDVEQKAGGLEIVNGGVPGTILVAGKPAFPLVSGRVNGAAVPVAAASSFGKGRIVAVGHEGFVSRDAMSKPSNVTFVCLSIDWLAGGASKRTVCCHKRDKRLFETAVSKAGCELRVLDRFDQLGEIELPAILLINPESYGVFEMPKVSRF